jgi:hypothetical protein
MGILDTSQINEKMTGYLNNAGLSMSKSQNVTIEEATKKILGGMTDDITEELNKKIKNKTASKILDNFAGDALEKLSMTGEQLNTPTNKDESITPKQNDKENQNPIDNIGKTKKEDEDENENSEETKPYSPFEQEQPQPEQDLNQENIKKQEEEKQKQRANQLNRQKSEIKKVKQRQQQERQKKLKKDFNLKQFAKQEKLDLDDFKLDPRNMAAYEIGEALGNELNYRINTGDFRFFLLAIAIALIKDAWDFIDFLTSTAFYIVISAALMVILMQQMGWLKRQMYKFIIKRYLVTFLIESIPFLNFAPLFTLLILSIKIKSINDIKKHLKALKELTKYLNKTK